MSRPEPMAIMMKKRVQFRVAKPLLPTLVSLLLTPAIWAAPETKGDSTATTEAASPEKQAENKPKKLRDPLFFTNRVIINEVYPREDLVREPEFLTNATPYKDFHVKPYVRMGKPVYPVLGFFKESGMDIFSGNLSANTGLQWNPSFLTSTFLELEGGFHQLKSGSGEGYREITDGQIPGSTRLTMWGFSGGFNIHPAEFFFLSIHGGLLFSQLDYENSTSQFVVGDQQVSLGDGQVNGRGLQTRISFGLDFPVVESLRLQVYTDYMMVFFSDDMGGLFGLGLGTSYQF